MMTRTLLARCAPLAIAASVALPAIHASAQDTVTAEPIIVLPDPAPVAAPTAATTPTIVLPEPVSESAPEPATVTAVEAEPATPAATSVERPARRSTAAPAFAVIAPAAEEAAPALPTAAETAAPVAMPVEPQPAAIESRNVEANGATYELALAGLLGALGLAAVGGIAFAASRRRRRRALEAEPEVVAYEPAVVPEPVAEPATARTAEAMPAPVFTPAAPVASAFAAPVVGAAGTTRRKTVRTGGDPVALPDEAPETFEERDALLRELVAAKPDKANPFTGVRARARRAKLIMQSLGQDFRDRKPRIDLSEYTNRWPALRGWQPATA